jgi:hypothetical protein
MTVHEVQIVLFPIVFAVDDSATARKVRLEVQDAYAKRKPIFAFLAFSLLRHTREARCKRPSGRPGRRACGEYTICATSQVSDRSRGEGLEFRCDPPSSLGFRASKTKNQVTSHYLARAFGVNSSPCGQRYDDTNC